MLGFEFWSIFFKNTVLLDSGYLWLVLFLADVLLLILEVSPFLPKCFVNLTVSVKSRSKLHFIWRKDLTNFFEECQCFEPNWRKQVCGIKKNEHKTWKIWKNLNFLVYICWLAAGKLSFTGLQSLFSVRWRFFWSLRYISLRHHETFFSFTGVFYWDF